MLWPIKKSIKFHLMTLALIETPHVQTLSITLLPKEYC